MSDKNPIDILCLISTIYRKTQIHFTARLSSLGLTSGLAPFLLLVCRRGHLAQNRFCELLDLDKSTVAKNLARLESLGYVQRKRCPHDNRSIDILPTEQARAIYPMLSRLGGEWAELLTEGLTDIERAIFLELLRKLADNAAAARD